MDILRHNFLNELHALQEKHGFYIQPEINLYSDDETLQIERIPAGSFLTCYIHGYNTFNFVAEVWSVQENDKSIKTEQGEK